jgi:hypothetical protein
MGAPLEGGIGMKKRVIVLPNGKRAVLRIFEDGRIIMRIEGSTIDIIARNKKEAKVLFPMATGLSFY